MEFLVDSCPGNIQGSSGALFMNLINTLMASQCAISTANHYPESYTPFLKEGEEFDYIVVGAGAGGSVVASRLSENKKMRVLLIEAGGIPTPTTEITSLLYNIKQTKEDWGYRPEVDNKTCLGFSNKQCRWPRGKMMGGSSSMNGAMYTRGFPSDYNTWAEENPGWDYETVIEYFKKIENIIPANLRATNNFGTQGYIGVNQTKSKHKLRDVIIAAAKELGVDYYPWENPTGYFEVLNNMENGLRVSASKGYLSKMKIGTRSNLFIAMYAQAGRVLIDPQSKTAKGVEIKLLKEGNKILTVKARKEVILSGGAVNSPQILMQSGVGAKDHLQPLGIPVIHDLKGVGGNLQDHIEFKGFLVALDDRLVHQYDTIDELYKFFRRQEGVFSTTDMMSLVGLISLHNNSQAADVEIVHMLNYKGNENAIKLYASVNGLDQRQVDQELAIIRERHLHKIPFFITRPKSRGKVLLKSNDPYEYPLLYANYLSDEFGEDLQAMMGGINFLKKLYTETEAFKPYNISIVRPFLENCNHLVDDDDYYVCAVRHLGSTVYHISGTCKMGPASDQEAVVDHKLRVHGIKNLRVADVSIMPFVTSINTCAPTMMIGERCADFIKETWTGQEIDDCETSNE